MRTQKTKIKASEDGGTVLVLATLQTTSILTRDELTRERKKLNDHICEALHRYGFHRQDIQVS